MSKILLEIGKIYECRNGERFRAEALTNSDGKTYRVQGEDGQGRITWRSLKGRFSRAPHPLDIVRECE